MTRSLGLLGMTLVLACGGGDGPTAPRAVASVTVSRRRARWCWADGCSSPPRRRMRREPRLPGRAVTWASSDVAVATVSPVGLVTGVANGPVTITATSESQSDAADLTVVTVVYAGVAAGTAHSCGVAADGAAYCWGYNLFAQLGNGDRSGAAQATPVLVGGGISLAAVSAAGGTDTDIGGHTCGLTAAGAAYCWGFNTFGQLGAGTSPGPEQCPASQSACAATPVPVVGGCSFAAMSAGHGHTCAITSAGAAWCWGFQLAGELGNGVAGTQSSPVAVVGGVSFAQVSAGYYHTCGVTAAGAAHCWGLNRAGQLGDGSTTDRTTPVPVSGGVSFTAVSAGADHTCGVTSAGAAWCWGFNGNGELGDGSTTDRLAPVPVTGGVSFAAVSAGTAHTCGVTSAGAAHCWGYNGQGQLGDRTDTTGPSPVPVAGGLSFASLSAGAFHSCGMTGGGAIYCSGQQHHRAAGRRNRDQPQRAGQGRGAALGYQSPARLPRLPA